LYASSNVVRTTTVRILAADRNIELVP
jgi:hypothetical protein